MKILISGKFFLGNFFWDKFALMLFITLAVTCCTLLLHPFSGFAQTDKSFKTKTSTKTSTKADSVQDASLHVISDKMVARQKSSMVEFIGNVKATRLDSVVYADSIQVYLYEDSSQKNDSQGNIEKIISLGNVKYTAGERQAFADKAVYTAKDQILVLTGKTARLMTGSNFVTGKKITLYRLEDKVMVESDGTNRVEALFNPEDNSLKKNRSESTQAEEDKPEENKPEENKTEKQQ